MKRPWVNYACTALVSALCGTGATLNWADARVREWQDQFSTAATYAGCGHKDQVGGFAFNPFPIAMDDATGEPMKPDTGRKARKIKVKQ